MIGGLCKSAGRTALIAAAGFFVGGVGLPSAKAADLGGDCCADLEERVAELEATTARKGNRKMNLTISGQVDRVVVWWDDGKSSKAFYGLDNRNSSTRLDFAGDAKVTPHTKIGFEIQIDNQQGATSSGFSQWNIDGTTNTAISSLAKQPFTGNNADDYFGALRIAMFYVENDKLGRIMVGRYNMAGVVGTIDLGGISAGASSSEELIGGNLQLRGKAGQYFAPTLSTLTDPASDQSRENLIRYDSPTVMGFILSSSLAEDGSDYGVMLRYANEFSGFRIGAGVGWEHYGQISAKAGCLTLENVPGVTPPAIDCAGTSTGSGPANLGNPAPDINAWGGSLAVMHVPTGLFLQGHYLHVDFDEGSPSTSAPVNGFFGQGSEYALNGLRPADQWLIQGGIAKNWTGFGNTSLFGEWSINNNWGAAGGPLAPYGASYGVGTLPGGTAVNGITKTEMTMYGFGITQAVDAAATEIFLDARHFTPEITCTGAANCTGAAGTGPAIKLGVEDMWIVVGGARVKF